jgi:PAS domain S-box-containing protein
MASAKSTKDTETLRQELAELNHILEANNTSLEEAQALTHLGSWQWSVATGEVSWSDELYRIYGMKPQERVLGYEDFLGLIHPEDRERIGGLIGEAFQTAKPFKFEHRIVLPNKKIRVLYGKGKAVTNKAGEIIRMVGTSQDITERKKADQALHLSDERFNAVTAATNDVVYDYDLTNNSIWFNEALCSQYGYPNVTSHTPEWWLEQIHPQDRKRIKDDVELMILSKKNNWTKEYRLRKFDGSYVDVRDRSFILRDPVKNPLRIIGSVLDVTQQKELERAKDKFISLVSHQLRTPLTAMRLLTDLLSDGNVGELNPMQQDYISKIGASTVRMIQLVSEILNVSQIERGRLTAMPVKTNVSSLIQWHIDELAPIAGDKKVTILYEPVSTVSEISVDPVLFGQIVHNLLTNAIRYTQKADTTITVIFEQANGGYVLSVEDQGIGIPKAMHKRVFSSFFRADNAVKMHGDGTGLGLYFIRLVIEATGGKAWFESEEGKGSTFFISLPCEGMSVIEGGELIDEDTHE